MKPSELELPFIETTKWLDQQASFTLKLIQARTETTANRGIWFLLLSQSTSPKVSQDSYQEDIVGFIQRMIHHVHYLLHYLYSFDACIRCLIEYSISSLLCLWQQWISHRRDLCSFLNTRLNALYALQLITRCCLLEVGLKEYATIASVPVHQRMMQWWWERCFRSLCNSRLVCYLFLQF